MMITEEDILRIFGESLQAVADKNKDRDGYGR